jgi:hypothetical protein
MTAPKPETSGPFSADPSWGVIGGHLPSSLDPVQLRLDALQMTLDLVKPVDDLSLVGTQGLVEIAAKLTDFILNGHDGSPSSVVGASEGRGSAGSVSSDPADPYADPTISTTEHVERLIRRDRDVWDLAIEVVTLLAPRVCDAEKALAARRLVDLVRLTGGAR